MKNRTYFYHGTVAQSLAVSTSEIRFIIGEKIYDDCRDFGLFLNHVYRTAYLLADARGRQVARAF